MDVQNASKTTLHVRRQTAQLQIGALAKKYDIEDRTAFGMTMRTCLALIGVLLATLPVPAQNAFFNRTTLLPVPGVNLPQPSAIFAADFNHDGLADLAVGGAGAVVSLLRRASGE